MKNTLRFVAFAILVVLSFANAVSAQGVKELTVKVVEFGTDHVESLAETHTAWMPGVIAGFRFGDFMLDGRFIGGSISDSSDQHLVKGYDRDMAVRFGYSIGPLAINAGYIRQDSTTDKKQIESVLTPPFSPVTGRPVPQVVVGVNTFEAHDVVSFEGIEIGFDVRGKMLKRMSYQMGAEFYPRLWFFDLTDNKRNGEFVGTAWGGGVGSGMRLEASLGVDLYKGIGIEVAGKKLEYNEPNGNNSSRYNWSSRVVYVHKF